jgi:uncharacterized protein (DUF2141 family)
VQDARNNQAVKNVLVGLFSHPDSLKPIYFAQTSGAGEATFNYLRKGTYYIRSFEDENRDLKISPTERVAFVNEPIHLDSSIIDSLPLRMYIPISAPRITSFSSLGNGLFVVGSNASLKKSSFQLNGVAVDESQIRFFTADSLVFASPIESTLQYTLITHNAFFTDTASTRINSKINAKNCSINSAKKMGFFPNEPISLTFNGAITNFDPSKIKVVNAVDSISLEIKKVKQNVDQLDIEIATSDLKSLIVFLEEEAVTIEGFGNCAAQSLAILKYRPREMGVIHLNLSAFNGPLIIEVKNANKIVQTAYLPSGGTIELTNLLPGDYTFSVIRDANNNARWDAGDLTLNMQPEEIQHFSQATTVRANWEIDVSLSPINE